ncbi:MAG: hypothetical protein F6K41_28110 [Symploca sp. SIO3E6]|nr:hypothetical protein [Caldora sp. SIO3E6]
MERSSNIAKGRGQKAEGRRQTERRRFASSKGIMTVYPNLILPKFFDDLR